MDMELGMSPRNKYEGRNDIDGKLFVDDDDGGRHDEKTSKKECKNVGQVKKAGSQSGSNNGTTHLVNQAAGSIQNTTNIISKVITSQQ